MKIIDGVFPNRYITHISVNKEVNVKNENRWECFKFQSKCFVNEITFLLRKKSEKYARTFL